jgi:hypothetical protein
MKSLREEQADMKKRWSDPLYRWTNDAELRRRYAKIFRDTDAVHKPNTSPSEHNTGEQTKEGARAESEGTE